MTARNGKIAHLPHELQIVVNRWLRQNQPTSELLAHLNQRPEVKEMLEREFGGEPITKQNLSAWRNGGYVEWETRQEWLTDAREIKNYAAEVFHHGSGSLVEQLTVVLAGRYASLLMKWDGEPDERVEKKLKLLGRLNQDVLALQRGQQRELRMKWQAAKDEWQGLEFAHKVEGWAAEKRAVQQEGPVAVELAKTIMDKVGLNYDELKRKAERRKAKEQARQERKARKAAKQAQKHGEGKTESDGGGPLTPALSPGERENGPQTAGETEAASTAPQEAKEGEMSTSQVVEAQGASRSVKVGQGGLKEEKRKAESEKGETSDTEHPTPNIEPEGGAAQWN